MTSCCDRLFNYLWIVLYLKRLREPQPNCHLCVYSSSSFHSNTIHINTKPMHITAHLMHINIVWTISSAMVTVIERDIFENFMPLTHAMNWKDRICVCICVCVSSAWNRYISSENEWWLRMSHNNHANVVLSLFQF